MRRLVMAVVLAGVAQGAQAGSWLDMPVLRGAMSDAPAPSYQTNWQGMYVGGQLSYGSSTMDFSKGTSDLVAYLLRNTTVENEQHVSQWGLMGKQSLNGTGFGGFIGYNWQWGEAVLGLEANYLYSGFSGNASDSTTRSFTTSDNFYNTVTVDTTSAMVIKDMLTFRARAAWAHGSFMPYAFGGLAVGRADIIRSATVTASGTYVGSSTPAPSPYSYGPATAADNQMNRIMYGYATGLGIDMMLIGNVFGRVEWEYTQFTSEVGAQMNTVRAAVGMKF